MVPQQSTYTHIKFQNHGGRTNASITAHVPPDVLTDAGFPHFPHKWTFSLQDGETDSLEKIIGTEIIKEYSKLYRSQTILTKK